MSFSEFQYEKSKPSQHFKSSQPFKVDLSCNISIDINVAMRLGELIRASKTEDKQLLSLGNRLRFAVKQIVDSLDDRQWDMLSSYMDFQSSSSDDEFSDPESYSNKAKRVVSNNFNLEHEPPLKGFVK